MRKLLPTVPLLSGNLLACFTKPQLKKGYTLSHERDTIGGIAAATPIKRCFVANNEPPLKMVEAFSCDRNNWG